MKGTHICDLMGVDSKEGSAGAGGRTAGASGGEEFKRGRPGHRGNAQAKGLLELYISFALCRT
jgi:hypothetical protein